MADPSIDVEKVVREVLAKLGLAPPSSGEAAQGTDASGSAARSASSAGTAPVAARSGETEGELVVLSHVVTMAELEGRLRGVRRLVVPPQAVVTPSVRDELHRKNIALAYDEPVPVESAGSVRLAMTVLGTRFDPASLGRALESEGIEVRTHQTDCLVDATDRLAGEVCEPNTLGLVVSTYPAIALCLANRHQGVRAVLGIDAARAVADAASVGANLLVVDPSTTSFLQIKQIVGRFCREGPRECPESLRQRLG